VVTPLERPVAGIGRKRPPVSEVRSPTVRRRELGALLRTLRQERSLTVEQVALELLCSPSKVSRMETGQRGATARDVRDLCDLYGVTDPDERTRMARLAAEGKQHGWWQSYDLDFSTYVGLEADAVSIKYYQSIVIPGLFQSADYARAMHDVVVQPKLSSERIDELVKVRLTRQELLKRDPPPIISAIIDEAALHRVVGGAAIMGAQLARMAELGILPNITIRIIPYAVGAHAAMDSTFRILEFGSMASSVVYVEGLVGNIYLDRPQDVVRYEEVFERLFDIALSPQESIELITRIGVLYENASV
jgi:transcriptional regulator with XRE-family HTH domain